MINFIINLFKTKHQECVWRGRYLYKTSCGHEFYDANEDGGIVTDWATYCPYCSGKIKTKYTDNQGVGDE